MTALDVRPATSTGVLIGELTPGSPEWLRCMTASKVAAVLGLSPWESRFSLWHRMAGLIDAEAETDLHRRGHYLEPAVAAWFADQHPEYQLGNAATWAHRDRLWQVATPDRTLHLTHAVAPAAVLECKTAANDEEWGEPGSDDIPVGYRAQVMWQMDVLGVPVAHVAVLTSWLEFAEYVVAYDPGEAALIRGECERFMASLPGGSAEQRPDLDEHSATYVAVRQLHPDIDGGDVDLPEPLADRYCRARAASAAADAEKAAVTTAVADAMGNAKRARAAGITVATRQAKAGGTPYLVAGRKLPTHLLEDPS